MPSRHAYIPVIYQHDNSLVTVKPLPLNKGEKQTVEELMALVGKPPITDFEPFPVAQCLPFRDRILWQGCILSRLYLLADRAGRVTHDLS